MMRRFRSLLFILPLSIAFTARAAGESSDTEIYQWMLIMLIAILLLAGVVIWVVLRTISFIKNQRRVEEKIGLDSYLKDLDESETALLVNARNLRDKRPGLLRKAGFTLTGVLLSCSLFAQDGQESTSLWSQPGIVITIVLVFIPLAIGIVFLIAKVNQSINRYNKRIREKKAQQLADYLLNESEWEIDSSLLRRQRQFETRPSSRISEDLVVDDPDEIIRNATANASIRFVATKKNASWKPNVDPRLSKLTLWYLGCAIFWLVFGTSVGEYLGIKFVAPDVDHQSWLSFGRLRPVHTNAVFWGWSSLAMLGIGHYVVSIVSNVPLASFRKGWISLILINAAVLLGSLSLMAGINNGGGEYREYVWPVMSLFGIALILTLVNFIQTIARRKTHEIYISNWYIVSAIMFTIVIAIIAYWPTWQDGLGETIVQGYYMHQGVGMWFMLFTLGIVYYFLPQQLNKPIYSYSLGILAFWTQIIFYTVIGTHHFVFSSIPWSLQTVAIVGSAGMIIPVVAGTTNFLMTFRGDFNKITTSYTLPFFLVGVIFYFTGSFQGTAEAFRYTNLLWHFTDFTVAHSHITMYGIIAFLLWGSIYAFVPRLTGKEPSHALVGAHFWLAFIGLLLYSVPLMIGGTLKGLMWMEGQQFIDSVSMMVPYWLWRAIGGTMMWISHLILAYNFYDMVRVSEKAEIKRMAIERIRTMKRKEEHEMVVN